MKNDTQNGDGDGPRARPDPGGGQPQQATVSSSWLEWHAHSVQAVAAVGGLITTIVLAVLAYFSWQNVQEQQDLSFKQFVLANSPSVRVYHSGTVQVDESAISFVWKVSNKGGPVLDLRLTAILLCCGPAEILGSSGEHIRRMQTLGKLARNEDANVRFQVEAEADRSWLEPNLQHDAKIYLYTEVEYTVPPELSLTGESFRGTVNRLSGYVDSGKRFEGVREPVGGKILDRVRNELLVAPSSQ